MTNIEQVKPKIEFPCANYPIKVLGLGDDDFSEFVVRIVKQHVPDFDLSTVSIKPSRKGNFQSVRFNITAQSEKQLKQLHQALISSERVKMVL